MWRERPSSMGMIETYFIAMKGGIDIAASNWWETGESCLYYSILCQEKEPLIVKSLRNIKTTLACNNPFNAEWEFSCDYITVTSIERHGVSNTGQSSGIFFNIR